MNTKMWTIIFSSISFFSFSLFGEINYPVEHPKQRFLKFIERLKPYAIEASKKNTPELQMQYFNSAGIRYDLNYFQNLIDIYDGKERYESLKPFFKAVKGLEDHMAHYIDLSEFVYTAQGGTPENAKKYAQLFQKEKEDFKRFIVETDWANPNNFMLDQMKVALESIDWLSLEKDRNFLLSQFARQMKKQHAEVYDMSDYELGMHEFRRDARRLTYMNTAVGELVRGSQQGGACPLNQPVPDDKTPIQNPTYVCEVSSCLVQFLSQLQNDISQYKHSAQNYTIKGMPVPKELINGADGVVKKMRASNVYLHLENQILKCRTEKSEKDK